MSATTGTMMAWLKAAATAPVTPPTPVTPVTPATPENSAWCNRKQIVVFTGETPSKTGLVTPVTPVTPQKTRAEVKTTETAPPDLPSAPPTPAPTAPPAPAKPGAWFRIDAPWRVASKAWQAHRWQCPMCMAADRTASTSGTGQRCEVGQALYEAYEAAPLE